MHYDKAKKREEFSFDKKFISKADRELTVGDFKALAKFLAVANPPKKEMPIGEMA